MVEGMLAVDRKLIHAYLVVDRNAGEFVVRNLGLRNVVAVGPALEEVPLSVVGRKADAALIESVSRASREMMEDGNSTASGALIVSKARTNTEKYGRWGCGSRCVVWEPGRRF